MRRGERDRLLFLAAACLVGLIAIISIKATGHHSQGLTASASYPVPEKKLGPLPARARPLLQTAAPRVVAPGAREPIERAMQKTFMDPEALSSGAPAFPPPAPPFVDPVADGGVTDSAPRLPDDVSPPPAEPLVISDVQLRSLSTLSATISWKTNLPSLGRAVYGTDGAGVWSDEDGLSEEHQTVLSGLAVATHYVVSVRSLDEWGRESAVDTELSTPSLMDGTTAEARDGGILVNGQPFFPTMVWGQCSDGIPANLGDGINLFMGDDCAGDRPLPKQLNGRAFSVIPNENADADGRGLIGSYYQDEWDAFLPSATSLADLQPAVIRPRPGRLTFLTLTNHFYSKAAPLPQGNGMYPALLDVPDIVGFDLYPLQVWCRPTFSDVYDSQRELVKLADGKPTFQWIETRQMEHEACQRPSLEPTSSTVRAETWLAVAGGAKGIGYFPHTWSREIGDAIEQTNATIAELTPALQAEAADAPSTDARVKVSVRQRGGALYIIAVNTSDSTLDTHLGVEGLADRKIDAVGENRSVTADSEGLADSFGPLAVHIYIAAPAGW